MKYKPTLAVTSLVVEISGGGDPEQGLWDLAALRS